MQRGTLILAAEEIEMDAATVEPRYKDTIGATIKQG